VILGHFVYLENMYFRLNGGRGMYAENSYWISINHSLFQQNYLDGFMGTAQGGLNANAPSVNAFMSRDSFYVRNCNAGGNLNCAGLNIAGTSGYETINVSISGGDISSNGTFSSGLTYQTEAKGIRISGARNVTIKGVYSEGNLSAAIFLPINVQGFSISECSLIGDGILAYGATYGKITGNWAHSGFFLGKSISAISNNGGTMQITATAHGIETHSLVYVTGLTGMGTTSGAFWANVVDANTIQLAASTYSGSYSGGGTVYKTSGIQTGSQNGVANHVTVEGNSFLDVGGVLNKRPGQDNDQSYNSNKTIHWCQNAAPATGTWEVGDTCLNAAPTAGGCGGWMVTTPGTPGTWKCAFTLAP
jgi:hypothetical protein